MNFRSAALVIGGTVFKINTSGLVCWLTIFRLTIIPVPVKGVNYNR